MKQFGLNSPLSASMWVGVGVISIAVCLVGFSSMIPDEEIDGAAGEELANAAAGDKNEAFGVLLTVGGTFMQSVQYAYEEKMLSGESPAPPWLLIGMEGLFGALLCLGLVYPIAGMTEWEDLENTMAQLNDNSSLVTLSAIFCVSVFILNSFSVLITFMLSSVWHAILDNFRPISIWATQLAIYSLTDGAHGEAWKRGSYLQLTGLCVMLLGTAIYNGSISVPGLTGGKSLLATGSSSASPALSRSPLLTKNASPGAEFGTRGSPYSARAQIDNASLGEKLMINVTK